MLGNVFCIYMIMTNSSLQTVPASWEPLPLRVFRLQEEWKGALDVLLLAEEAFGCCKSSLTENVDNGGLLMLDIVW